MTPSRSKIDRNVLASLAISVLAALSAAGCGGGEEDFVSAAAVRESAEHARGRSAPSATPVQFTPVAMHVGNVPIPVLGSDDRYHVVYEIELANPSGSSVDIERSSVLDARSGEVIATLDAAQVGERLVVRDSAAVPGRLGAAQVGLLYMHVVFDSKRAIPHALVHSLEAVVGTRPITETAARIRLAQPTELVLDAPLRGPRYIAGDGCCDSVRHVRATLPLNGRLFTAQRSAIDWEQLDEQGRIYVGNPKDPASYVIYGKPAYAVADARVVLAVDGLPDTPPGALAVRYPDRAGRRQSCRARPGRRPLRAVRAFQAGVGGAKASSYGAARFWGTSARLETRPNRTCTFTSPTVRRRSRRTACRTGCAISRRPIAAFRPPRSTAPSSWPAHRDRSGARPGAPRTRDAARPVDRQPS